MGIEKHYFPFLIIVLSFISQCCISSFHDDLQFDNNNNNYIYIEEEYGENFGVYPSYFNPIKGVKFYNSVKLAESKFSADFKKVRRSLASSDHKIVNVLDFGAKGDGNADDTKAFQKAWKEACSSSSDVTFVVPKDNSFLLKPIKFKGSCKSHMTMQIYGTIIASDDRSDYSEDRRHWLVFDRVKNLLVEGGGIIDGNGDIWWKNSCKINKSKPCEGAPTALTFYKCTNLVVNNVRVQNAQQMHVSFQRCKNVEASNVMINSPEQSPNTDGIHITATQNIQISNATIATGDDCISIVNGSEKIRATDITCGPGHGISIGSLGSRNSEAHVSDVVVNGAKLSGTTNGVRIKTWQGGTGSATDIKFENVEMENVKNPIIIDQNYCDQKEPCKQQSSAVQIKDVVYKNINGTSASSVAIKFECSENHPCEGIVLQNVNLVGEEDDGKVKAVCNNVVKLQNLGTVSPTCPN